MLYNLLQLSDDWLDRIGLYSLLQVMYQLEFRAFAAVVLSFAIVLLFGRRTIRWLIRQKVGDAPEFYRADVNKLMASKAATPTMGGILIVSAILAFGAAIYALKLFASAFARGPHRPSSWRKAISAVLGPFPEFLGVCSLWLRRK